MAITQLWYVLRKGGAAASPVWTRDVGRYGRCLDLLAGVCDACVRSCGGGNG